MSVTRRATSSDATWARGWTVTTAAELGDIPAPLRGDVAYAEDTARYYTWRDDNTWEQAVTTADALTAAQVLARVSLRG